jgi:hypothetical protein
MRDYILKIWDEEENPRDSSWEEFETLVEAEARAKWLRNRKMKVEIYKLL